MENESLPNNENSGPKVVLGLRCSPELKGELTEEALDFETSLSEYCECILLNRHEISEAKAKTDIQNLEEKYNALRVSYEDAKEQLKNRIVVLEEEREHLLAVNSSHNALRALLEDARLLNLFTRLKGDNDKLELPDGRQISIQYNRPEDLLYAMIYSFKIKK